MAGLTVAVPRFSNVAIGVRAGARRHRHRPASILQLPTLASLWETGYGQTLLVKIALLLGAVLLAAVNLLRTRPRLLAGSRRGARRRCCCAGWSSGEVVVVAGAVFAAAVLTSLAPPAKARRRYRQAGRAGRPGAGRARRSSSGGYRFDAARRPQPGRRAQPFEVRVSAADGRSTGAA